MSIFFLFMDLWACSNMSVIYLVQTGWQTPSYGLSLDLPQVSFILLGLDTSWSRGELHKDQKTRPTVKAHFKLLLTAHP